MSLNALEWVQAGCCGEHRIARHEAADKVYVLTKTGDKVTVATLVNELCVGPPVVCDSLEEALSLAGISHA